MVPVGTSSSSSLKGYDFLLFDFEKFQKILEHVYPECYTDFSLDDTSSVFLQYFIAYEEHTGHAHPPIKAEQIKRIVEKMDSWDDGFGRTEFVLPFQYEYMIYQHFKTKYRRCDFNINHFFSGRIREMRYYDSEREPMDDDTLYKLTGICRERS